MINNEIIGPRSKYGLPDLRLASDYYLHEWDKISTKIDFAEATMKLGLASAFLSATCGPLLVQLTNLPPEGVLGTIVGTTAVGLGSAAYARFYGPFKEDEYLHDKQIIDLEIYNQEKFLANTEENPISSETTPLTSESSETTLPTYSKVPETVTPQETNYSVQAQDQGLEL